MMQENVPQERVAPETSAAPEQDRGDAPPSRTGLVLDNRYLRHDTGFGHPERPERLAAIRRNLEVTGLLDELVRIEPAGSVEPWLEIVHAAEYIARVKQSCRQEIGFVDSPDAPASRESYEVATVAAGGVLAAIDAVMHGAVRNAFCAVRPPGHHALPNHAMGFCLFNNIAIGARYVQKKHGLSKVLIVDWDVHHGNGTQEIFYDDPAVLYFSIHRHPFYPGTGSVDQTGAGEGRGHTVNVPLPGGCDDERFVLAFEEALTPAAAHFAPDFVLVSAGFDAHRRDPLGGMRLTEAGFARMTHVVQQIARQHAGDRLVSVLEGGYDLDGLAASVEAHLRVLMQ